MPFETTCPKGHRLQVSDSHLGQRIQCPACNESFVVNDENKNSGCRCLARGCRARNNAPEFGKLTGLGIDLDRSGMLLDDNVATQ